MALITELVSCWRERDVFISQHLGIACLSVEDVDQIEHSINESCQNRTVSVIGTIVQVDVAEEGLLDEGRLSLPRRELDQKLL